MNTLNHFLSAVLTTAQFAWVLLLIPVCALLMLPLGAIMLAGRLLLSAEVAPVQRRRQYTMGTRSPVMG